MLIRLCVVFALLSGTLATPCLSSNKFTATTMQTMATLDIGASFPTIYDVTNIMDYDADVQMISTKSYRLNAGIYDNFTTVQDFKTGKQYESGTGYCNEEQLSLPFVGPCLPDSATETMTYIAAGGVTVHVYAMEITGSRYYIHITDTGEPFAYVTYGSDTAMQQMNSLIFGNVQMGVLSDPHVFDHLGCHGQAGLSGDN